MRRQQGTNASKIMVSLTQNFDGHRLYHRFHVLGTRDRVLRVTFERSSVVVHGRRESQRARGLQRAILL